MESNRLPDELDRSIIDALRDDIQITNKKIALRLDVAESTIAARIRSMVDDHIMRVTAQRDLYSHGYRVLGFLFVSVSDRPTVDVAEDFAALDETISVSKTLGQAQLFCVVAGKTRKDLLDVVTDHAALIDGVSRIVCDICLDIEKLESGFGDLHTVPPHFEVSGSKAEKDEMIVRQLQADGRVSNREMARQLGVSEANIRQRLKRMIDNGTIQLGLVCDPFRIGMGAVGIVRMFVLPRALKGVAAALVDQQAASFVAYTSGTFNLIALVMAHDVTELADFISSNVANMDGVREIETTSVTGVVKQRYDLVRIHNLNEG